MSLKAQVTKWLRLLTKAATWKRVEGTKTLLEIILILAAAGWAVARLTEGELFSFLAPKAQVTGELKWYPSSKGSCQAEYEIEFKNIGNVPVKVENIRLRSWSLNEPNIPSQTRVWLLDPMNFRGEKLSDDSPKRMNVRYAPGASDKQGFSFIVKRSDVKMVLFKIDMWRKGETVTDGDGTWSDYRWDWVCAEGPPDIRDTRETKTPTP